MAVTAMTAWHEAKLYVERSVPVSHDALHLLFGVFAWLSFALLLRRPISSWYPLLWLIALIGCNEAIDLWTERWHDVAMQYREGGKDFAMTLLVPTLLALVAHVRPELFGQARLGGRGRRRKQEREQL